MGRAIESIGMRQFQLFERFSSGLQFPYNPQFLADRIVLDGSQANEI
jgi:hypothetical protein